MAHYEIGWMPDALSAEVIGLLEATETATAAIPGPDSTLLHYALGCRWGRGACGAGWSGRTSRAVAGNGYAGWDGRGG